MAQLAAEMQAPMVRGRPQTLAKPDQAAAMRAAERATALPADVAWGGRPAASGLGAWMGKLGLSQHASDLVALGVGLRA
jgi:hypothetical protein